jgi:hypothetical protein
VRSRDSQQPHTELLRLAEVAEPVECLEKCLLRSVGRGVVVPQDAPGRRLHRSLAPRHQAGKSLSLTAKHGRNDFGVRLHGDSPPLLCPH